jgi:hypothetical protein
MCSKVCKYKIARLQITNHLNGNNYIIQMIHKSRGACYVTHISYTVALKVIYFVFIL